VKAIDTESVHQKDKIIALEQELQDSKDKIDLIMNQVMMDPELLDQITEIIYQ